MRLNNKTISARVGVGFLTLIFAAPFFSQSTRLQGQQVAVSETTATPTSRPSADHVHPFEPTEELVYVAEFSRALLKKVDVADFRFTASRQTPAQNIPGPASDKDKTKDYLFKFTGDVSSKGFFAKLFNLRFREQIESLVDPASFSVTKTKRVDEQGKRSRVSETTYSDGRLRWSETDPNNPSRPPREGVANFAGRIQDVLSAIYYLRTQPLEVGRSFELNVSDSGVVYQVPVQVVERKIKKTALGRVEVFRVDPQVFGTGRMLQEDGQFSIWITSDSRRVPVSARIKLRYGTFDITLKKVVRNPALPSVTNKNNTK